MGDVFPSWRNDRRRCGLLGGIIFTRGFLELLSIWSFYCCCSWARGFKLDGQSADAGTNINLTSGSSISSRSSMNTGEVVDEGELGFYPLVRSATGLLRHNYVEELEATIPSPFIDPHQVKMFPTEKCENKSFVEFRRTLFSQYVLTAIYDFFSGCV